MGRSQRAAEQLAHPAPPMPARAGEWVVLGLHRLEHQQGGAGEGPDDRADRPARSAAALIGVRWCRCSTSYRPRRIRERARPRVDVVLEDVVAERGEHPVRRAGRSS